MTPKETQTDTRATTAFTFKITMLSTDPSGYKCVLVYLLSFFDNPQYFRETFFQRRGLPN